MTKTIKEEVFTSDYGFKVMVERPYTREDALADLNDAVIKRGGFMTITGDAVTLHGITSAEAQELAREYQTPVRVRVSGTSAEVEKTKEYCKGYWDNWSTRAPEPKKDQGPFGWPSQAQMSAAGAKSPTSRIFPNQAPMPQALPKKKKKKIAEVAPIELSTWNFQSMAHLERLSGHRVRLVGQHYRKPQDRAVLSWKNEGNMALLVAEPDNDFDMNAVMVLMWNDQTKVWHHVGYVPREQACILRGKWTGDYRNVLVARITNIPNGVNGHRYGPNIMLTLTGEVRTYPNYNALIKSSSD